MPAKKNTKNISIDKLQELLSDKGYYSTKVVKILGEFLRVMVNDKFQYDVRIKVGAINYSPIVPTWVWIGGFGLGLTPLLLVSLLPLKSNVILDLLKYIFVIIGVSLSQTWYLRSYKKDMEDFEKILNQLIEHLE